MKKIIVIAWLFASATAVAGDFRQATWGMSREQVKSTEPASEWMADGEIIAFETTVAGLKAFAAYIFIDDRLTRGVYSITERHANNTAYVSDYRNLGKILEKKYGQPEEDETVWLDDLYRDDPSDWGMAVATGALTMYQAWVSDRSKIILLLTGDNFSVTLKVEYSSQYLRGLEQERREQDVLKDF